MAAAILRRNLISFFSASNSSLLLKSHFSASLCFSIESKKPPLDAAAVAKFLIDSHHFSPDAAAQIAARARLRNQQNADSVLEFLKQTGFSDPQLEKILKISPKLLSAHLDANIKPKFEILRGLGLSAAEMVEVVSSQSRLLYCSPPRISASIAALKSVLGSAAAAARFFKSSGLFLRDLESTLLPNVEFLKSCGVSMDQITQLMSHIPRFFLHTPQKMRKFVEKADEMGADRRSGTFIHAVRVVSSMTAETWEMKLEALRRLGFSDGDIARAFRSSPKVLTTSAEKMRRVEEVVEGSGRYDRASIVAAPSVLLYSVERRLWPRVEILRVLERKGRIGDWPSLATMVMMTDAKFFERFVSPNLKQVGDLWSPNLNKVDDGV